MVERHYCKFCNVWMQGDKAAIKHHEQGKKHKEKVEETLKQKRKAKSDAFHAEKDLQEQLQAIEEAALARHAQDLAGATAVHQEGSGGQAPPPPPPRRPGQTLPPPPPPRRPAHLSKRPQGNSGAHKSARQWQHDEEDDNAVADGDNDPEEDDFGVYATNDDVYLEGKRHETKLETNSACEIWVEELEEWFAALIERAVVHTIPNTDRSFREFTVTYMAPGHPTPITETKVHADRLRIKLPAGMTLEVAQRMIRQMETGVVETAADTVEPVVIDEATGMGEWSTVVVREIDESDEAIAQRAADAQAEADARAALEKRRDALEDFDAQGDDALGAFNPYGGSYKGVVLTEHSVSEDAAMRIATSADVGFKKRKTVGAEKAMKKKQKRIRSHDDDD